MKYVAPTLQIQQLKTFKYTIVQDKIIKEVHILEGYIKFRNKEEYPPKFNKSTFPKNNHGKLLHVGEVTL